MCAVGFLVNHAIADTEFCHSYFLMQHASVISNFLISKVPQGCFGI